MDIKKIIEEWLRNTENDTPLNRANLLEEIVRTFYNFSKFERPGGEGIDGLNGPERQGLARVLEAAIEHYDNIKDNIKN